LAWAQQTDISAQSTNLPPSTAITPLFAKFYPCKIPGEALGIATLHLEYPSVYGNKIVIRALRTTDSGVTFTHSDTVLHDYLTGIGLFQINRPFGVEPKGLWFDSRKGVYATIIVDGRPFGNFYGGGYPMMMMTSSDEGLTWIIHPAYTLPSDVGPIYELIGQGFYNGRFYITFFEQGSGKSSFSYSTDDYGVTWVKHAHSKDAGRGLSSVVQLYPSGKAFPHRLDM
jgi:hypothetical protein